jgi:NADH:ubiquinone oxidoreductase subunit 6 (subunit J)
MNLLVPLAALLGIEVEAITDRAKKLVIVYAVISLFLLLGCFFLVAAGFFALATQIGPIYAALVLGGVFLVLALAVFAGAQIGESNRKRRTVERRRSSETGAFVTTAALTALPVLLRSPVIRKLGLPAAALAAFLLVRNADDNDD